MRTPVTVPTQEAQEDAYLNAGFMSCESGKDKAEPSWLSLIHGEGDGLWSSANSPEASRPSSRRVAVFNDLLS